MTLAVIPSGTAVFVDANIFVYVFAPDPVLGPPCVDFLERIELGDLRGFASTHVPSDVAHRLMCLEACTVFGWPYAGIVQRLKTHPSELRQLDKYDQAIDEIIALGLQFLSPTQRHVALATIASKSFGLLSGDALTVALMQDSGITQLASHDADFDRVASITRHGPL